MSEESKNDVVKEARELLGKIPQSEYFVPEPDKAEHWHQLILRMEFVVSSLFRVQVVPFSNGHVPTAQAFAAMPNAVRALCDEVEELRRRNATQEESITHLQSQLRVMKEAIRAAIEFADLSQRCPQNCGPNCCAEGKSRMLRAEALSIQLRSAITPKGSD